MADDAPPALLLYDGACGLCTRGVLFTYARDPRGRVHFASLQGETGRRLLREHGLPHDLTTVVLVDEKGAHVRSTAVLRTLRRLRAPWSWLYAFRIVPRPVRDAAYKVVASRRRRFGAAAEACALPTPALRARMRD